MSGLLWLIRSVAKSALGENLKDHFVLFGVFFWCFSFPGGQHHPGPILYRHD